MTRRPAGGHEHRRARSRSKGDGIVTHSHVTAPAQFLEANEHFERRLEQRRAGALKDERPLFWKGGGDRPLVRSARQRQPDHGIRKRRDRGQRQCRRAGGAEKLPARRERSSVLRSEPPIGSQFTQLPHPLPAVLPVLVVAWISLVRAGSFLYDTVAAVVGRGIRGLGESLGSDDGGQHNDA
jgi:hypothetical protein